MSRELYEMAWQYGEFKDSPDDDETMDWAAARIRELEAQLAAAQENTLGPWFLTQGLCTLDAIADHIITLQRQLAAAQERGVVLARGILAVQNLINESRGVDGYHRNGNIAEWDELLDDGCMLDEYSKALHLIHKTTTDSLRELPAPPEQEADHDHQ